MNDTIAAIATPPGRGGICIIRISGADVPQLAEKILGKCPRPRYAQYAKFHDGAANLVIDDGIAIYFPGPASFTGEDVLELQGHGGSIVSNMILTAALHAGARVARPGEFSERAFLNNKLDLVQAEAVADLIDAGSQQAARAALRTLQGEFSQHVYQLLAELTELRVYVESSIDFVDEEIELLQRGDIYSRLKNLTDEISQVIKAAQRGRVLGEGINIVIAGKPNAGKSSLMNALSGRDSAIVTDIPGTTRDIIREHVLIDGIPAHILDTAGIRHSTEALEQEGIRRATESLSGADLILWVHDDTGKLNQADYRQIVVDRPCMLILNKIDLSGRSAGLHQDIPAVALSAVSGDGIDELCHEILRITNVGEQVENEFSASQRHMHALNDTRNFLEVAIVRLQQQLRQGDGGELLAEELRMAQQALSGITGDFKSHDLLGKIFSRFCIGK